MLASLVTDSRAIPSVDHTYVEEHDHRLLIVDDEEPVRNLFAKCLAERYSCETAANAQEALDRLQQKQFALVITDIQMPGIGGIELLRKINELYRDTAVIIASGIDRTQRVIDAIRMGAYDYLVKPCELDVLELCVQRALERRTLLRNARRYKEDLENRNIELEKMASLGQLAAGVAHELNNPAGFIFSNMTILPKYVARVEEILLSYEQVLLNDSDAERIEAVKSKTDYENVLADLTSIAADSYNGAERIRDIVQNLRLFSRLDEAEFKQVDLHESIESTIRLLSKYYSSPLITLRRDYGNLPLINCYAGQLNQVWMNLLANAAQAIGDARGEVRIKTECDQETVSVCVSDTGKGIAPEHLKKIFDPFFTTKPVGEGTGLGLSISHGIVARHRGTLTVESVLGEGTSFKVSLPVHLEVTSGNDHNKDRSLENES